MNTQYDIYNDLREKIRNKGGFKNNHLHIDKSYTLNRDLLKMAESDLKEKWLSIDRIKKISTEKQIYNNMKHCVISQHNYGIHYLNTFLDCDEIIKDKALNAFDKLKDCNTYGHAITFKSCNQTLKGVIDKNARYWFDFASERTDYIGSLPAKDAGMESEHLDIVFKRAKELDKKIYIHVDQFRRFEKETELVINKVEQYEYQSKVNLIHCLSLNCFDKEYRHSIYKRLEANDIGIICCPTSWIDDKRDDNVIMHKSPPITPIDEMIEYNIRIGIGTDNISDMVTPFSTGNMLDEISILARMCRMTDLDKLSDIATRII